MIYRLMDRLFDPPPEEFLKAKDKAGIRLYYESEDENYKRCKRRYYRYYLLYLVSMFFLGVATSHILGL